jgi:aminoglycoside phosphotransferase (APT) family kinase protein
MTYFEIDDNGATRKLVARQPNAYMFGINPQIAAQEFRVLERLQTAGLPVQTPVYLDAPTDDHPHPFFVVKYIEGRPETNPVAVSDYLERYAQQLAEIHKVTGVDLSFLPCQDRGFGDRRPNPNAELRETEIRDALESMPPKTRSNTPVLRHGDFWPGNVLWRDGEIVGVIDWEECLIGEPLADVAICRLDLLWILGFEATEEFTDRYRQHMNLDWSDLPCWDLCASLRPISNIEEWAPSYAQLGREDVTAETMKRDHLQFVDQALTRLR